MVEGSEATQENHLEVLVARERGVARLMSWKGCEGPPGATYFQRRVLPAVGDVLEGEPKALGISPQEWLLVFSSPAAIAHHQESTPQLSEQSLVMVDVTAGLAVLTLRGPGAPRALTQSCGIDPRALGAGHCARVRFAHIPVVLHSVKSLNVYELYFQRSYGAYLASWLNAIARNSKG